MPLPKVFDMADVGVCDCHVHIVGPTARFSQIPSRTYTAGPAELPSLRAVAEPLGVRRYVVVQPSFYGTNNACLLEALEALGGRGRGVIAADPGRITATELEWYASRGACGVRINLYSKSSAEEAGPLGEILARWEDKLPPAGWHIEVIAPLAALLSGAAAMAGSPVPIVIDHYGLPGDAEPDTREGRRLLELLTLPQVWVKLSAPYRTLKDPLATKPPGEWLRALMRVAPDRCVWGSDWPHTPAQEDHRRGKTMVPYRELSYQRVLEDLLEALPQEAIAGKILRDNPQRLYGFSAE